MATKRLQDVPIKPDRVAINRDDPRQGEGPFVNAVSARDAELVSPNGLVWNGVRQGYVDTEPTTSKYPTMRYRNQGNRSSETLMGGNSTVNGYGYDNPRRRGHGNESGE